MGKKFHPFARSVGDTSMEGIVASTLDYSWGEIQSMEESDPVSDLEEFVVMYGYLIQDAILCASDEYFNPMNYGPGRSPKRVSMDATKVHDALMVISHKSSRRR
jgi:hypothetical protein